MNQFTLAGPAPGSTGAPVAYVTPVGSASSSIAGQQGLQQLIVQAAPVGANGQVQQLQPTFVTAPVAAPAVQQQAGAGPSSPDNGANGTPHHPIAEFLYQLTKMLTDDNNEIIEWVNGRIKVHHPERLEGEVLHKYFRHSKFASFQRQLNYFGFRKIAGKGKMSPCAYVNEAATSDIRSLLTIKRKTNGSAARKAALAQQRSLGAAGLLPPGSQVVQISGIPGLVAAAPQAAITTELLQKALGASLNQQALANVGIYPQMIIQNPATFAIQQAAQQQLQAATMAAAPVAPVPAPGPAPTDANSAAASAGRQLGDHMLYASDSTLAALARQQGGKQSEGNLSVLSSGSKTGSSNQLELINQQVLRNSALNLAALGLGPASAATQALSGLQASAAMAAPTGGAMPASAALTGAASAAVNPAQSLFESSNLSALVGKDDKKDEKDDKGPAPAPNGRLSSSNLLGGRMPSANSIFPDTLSSVSLTGLGMPGALSSNRLNSIVSLGSLLSRDLSTADMGLTTPANKKPTTAASLGMQLNPLTTLSNIAHSVAPAPAAPAPGPGAAPAPTPLSAHANPAALLAALSAGGGNASALLAAMAPNATAPGPVSFAPGPLSFAPGTGPASALLAAAALTPGPTGAPHAFYAPAPAPTS
eukprot:CAMPEP_0194027156 /NCGR_PEP_ID=MMETSP0009_2-20130614/1358_1 /TAXON_ID=210454 /ORGANISM="Grammatophora oceanica, Strain CCMP 410" /LENGTH=647 /DNA_ID=CAMNT_0038666117 /DNA_START=112 /DNA_END=2055 /DNA_ORIENTATION=-